MALTVAEWEALQRAIAGCVLLPGSHKRPRQFLRFPVTVSASSPKPRFVPRRPGSTWSPKHREMARRLLL
jgi:hypothetical protein